ncbi:MAG: tetratricopeptide repeat protein, partial [Candidatus Sulfotelmatobacter sp.]
MPARTWCAEEEFRENSSKPNIARARRRQLWQGIWLSHMVIDSRFPWKLPRARGGFPPYPYRMSIGEWDALLAKAEQGHPESEWGVAERFGDGVKDRKGRILVKRSTRRAEAWLRRAAEHGCASAQCNLGVLVGDKKHADRGTREPLEWLEKAFRAGDSCAATNIAIMLRQNGNFRKAVQWFRKSAASGDDDALIQIGIHHYWGKGVRKNPMTAVRCFRKAIRGKNICEAGRDDAFFYLGIAYLEGKGVRASVSNARKLLQRANIDNDHPAAQG